MKRKKVSLMIDAETYEKFKLVVREYGLPKSANAILVQQWMREINRQSEEQGFVLDLEMFGSK